MITNFSRCRTECHVTNPSAHWPVAATLEHGAKHTTPLHPSCNAHTPTTIAQTPDRPTRNDKDGRHPTGQRAWVNLYRATRVHRSNKPSVQRQRVARTALATAFVKGCVGISFAHQQSLAQCTNLWLRGHGLAGVGTRWHARNNNYNDEHNDIIGSLIVITLRLRTI